jgi:hypothetical protein
MSPATRAQRFVVFTLAEGAYAVPEAAVRSCLSLPRLTALDDTAPWVIGAFDWHGDLTPVVSIAAYLGQGLPAAAGGDLVIVAEAGGHPVGLHAHALLGVEPALEPWSAQWTTEREPATAVPVQLLLPGGRTRVVLVERLPISARDAGAEDPRAEGRLLSFEHELDPGELDAMERRADRYSRLFGAARRHEPPEPLR